MNANETWLPVVGYEGLYEVSNMGAVRSVDRLDSIGRPARGRILSPDPTDSGHLRVTLCRDSRTRRLFVHRIVLMTFVCPRPEGMEACHGDGDPTNNAVPNLRWDTKSANAQDRIRHGRDRHASQTHCSQGHAYDASNTYVASNGWRRCRICTLAWQKAKRDRIKQERAA